MNKKITKKLIWSGGDTRHLIRLMKEHFDLTGEKSVLNPQKRLRIQKELGIPWARIQSKWKYMKSYHQQLVNKHVATKVEPEHEFYKRLSFLNDTKFVHAGWKTSTPNRSNGTAFNRDSYAVNSHGYVTRDRNSHVYRRNSSYCKPFNTPNYDARKNDGRSYIGPRTSKQEASNNAEKEKNDSHKEKHRQTRWDQRPPEVKSSASRGSHGSRTCQRSLTITYDSDEMNLEVKCQPR